MSGPQVTDATVVVEGLAELQRDLGKYAKDVKRELRTELRTVAEPVRVTAQGLAESRISNIGPVWERMRVGVTQTGVYLAPKARNRGGSKRPNLAGLLLEKAMEPAVDGNAEIIEHGMELMLDRVAAVNGWEAI